MKPLLLVICIIFLASCENNSQTAIQTLCKGVNSTGKACSVAIGLHGNCPDCLKENELIRTGVVKLPDITSLESKENSLSW